MKRKFTFLIAAAVMLLTMMATTGTMWGQTPATLVSGSGTSGYAIPTGWSSSGTVEGGSYLKFDNGTITSPSFDPHTGLSFTYTVATFGSGTNHPLTIRILNAETDAVITELTTATPTSSSYISTNSPLDLGDVYVAFKIQMYAPTGKGVRLRNYSITGTPYSGSGNLEDSDLAITDAPVALEFDMYNNATAQTVSYTTSSTGAITITPSSPTSYFSYVHDADNGTITVTPLAVTPSAQTVTINQAADDTYKAGSVTFTVSIEDSTPFSGGDITFVAGTDQGTSTGQNPDQITKSVVTVSSTSAALAVAQYRFYKNSTTTISTTSGNITQIVFTHCDNSYPISNLSNIDANGTWTGSATSVDFVASAQARASQIVVTVDTGSTPSPSITANNVNIAYTATNGSIAYTVNNPVSGGALTATTTAEWLTLGTVGETVPFTCSANELHESRTATVTLTYTYGTKSTVTKDVTITQAAAPIVYTSIPALFAAATTTETNVLVTFNNWVVSGVSTNGKNIFVTDNNGNGFVIYYNSDMSSTYAVGNILTGTAVSCSLKKYNGFAELLNVGANDLTITTGGTVTTANVAMADLAGVNTGALLHYENLTCSINNSNYYLSDGTTTLQVYNALFAFNALESGKKYNITGVYQQYNSTKEILPRSAADIELVTGDTPVINASNVEIDYDATSGEIAYTITNPASGVNLGATTSAEWVSNIAVAADKVTFTTTANEGTEDRTATFTLTYTGADDKVVTVTQGHYVVDYATLPFEFDGGRADIATTTGLTQEGLDSDYASGPKLKFNGTGDWVILKINERPGILTFDINGNSFSGGTFKVQTSADGETYTDLQSYTDLGATQSEEFDNLAENVRYIKWIYTNKSSGNVGLGNIALAKYVAPVPSITLEDNSIEAGANTGLIGGIEVTYNNIESVNAEIWFCNAEGNATATYDWLTVGFDKDNNITYNINPNTGDARTAYFKVHETSENVYSELVTVSQEAPEPNITLEEYLIEAGSNTGLIGGIEVTYANYDNPEDIESEVWFCNAEGTADATYDHTWLTVSFDKDNNIEYNITVNTGAARTAYFKVHETSEDIYSNVVTVTQDELVILYSVTFNCDGGTFVPNEAFPTSEESKPAGTYTLPSATKSGLTFDGWKLDGTDDIYDAGAQYEVTGNVSFTAQWSSAVTGTITFGSAEGSTAINSTSVNGDDSAGNTWTITTVFSGQTSFTQNASYSQVGASSKPAESITFTTTLANEVNITAFSAKFGGFSNTAGDIALIVDETTIGTGSLNASEDVVVTNTTTESGTVLTVTVTNIAKGVKCYYISYTYEVDDTPYIFINPGPYDLNSEGGDAVLPVTYTNMPTDPQAEVIFYESNGETQASYDWITATINGDGNVAGHIDANTGDARSAYFKVKGIDGDNNPVYSELVTINQAAYTLSIVFETTSLDIEAGGEQDRIISFEYEGLGENPTFTVRQYDATGQTQTTYDWLTTTITDVHKVNITVAANTGDARSAYFKVYGENGTINTESNLVTINQAAAAPAGGYTLVTNASQIVSGAHYIIASGTTGSIKAMAGQNQNNRAAVSVTATNNSITEIGYAYEFVINGPQVIGEVSYYTIYDANENSTGYLYAAGAGGTGSNNYLKTRETNANDDKGIWTITFSGDAVVITAKATGRNLMRYNSGSDIFSCYASNQQAIYLFKKDTENIYNFYGTTELSSLTIANGESFIIHDSGILDVAAITNNGGADNLLIKDGGQLIHNNAVYATVQKNIAQWTDTGGWYFIASPVENLSTSAVTGINNEGHYDLFAYDEENALWRSNTGPGAPFTTLERGKGYLYANESDVTLSFAGLMIGTATEVTKTLSRAYPTENDNVKGYNLMGNPFTRNLVADDMVITREGYDDIPVTSCLVINIKNDGSEYETCDFEDGDVIKPGQGFFIQATAVDPENPSLTPNQNLVINKSSSKDEMVDKGFIRIAVGNDNNMDKAYIHVKNGNTLRKIAFTNSSSVYVMNHGDDYAAARVEELAGTMPVHFDAVEDGEYTITINAKNIEAHSMHLIDNFTGEVIDLLVNSSYTFFANESDDPARFRLAFDFNDYTGVNESYVNGSFAYQIGDELIVNGDGTLQVFDVMGRYVGSYEVHGSERISVSAYNTGVYMLRFIGKNVMTQKIVVR